MQKFIAGAAIVASVLAGAAAQAASRPDTVARSTATPVHSNKTAIRITPYLWGANLDGHVAPFRGAPEVDVDKSFSDIFHSLNAGGFLNLWLRHDRYVFAGDIMYIDTTEHEDIDRVGNNATPGLAVKVGAKQFTATLEGGYRVIDRPKVKVAALTGVRFWHVKTSVRLRYAGRKKDYEEGFGWVDPLVGAHASYALTERLSLQLKADVGGFGAGSDLTWQALGAARYAFTRRLSANIGYKALYADYRTGGHVFDARSMGPAIGITIGL